MLKEENKRRILITIGVLSFVIGIGLLSSNYFNEKVDKAYNDLNLQILSMNDVVVEELEEEVEEQKPSPTPTVTPSKPKVDIYEKYYVAKLSIPKINLNKGLVDMTSKYNVVSKNIQTIKGSTYPNVLNGNYILASHSGTNSVSHFRYLYKLVKGDKCSVTYKGKTYNYKIVNIYTKPKIGELPIYRDYNKTTLTLITCTRGVNDKQTIYIAELFSIE